MEASVDRLGFLGGGIGGIRPIGTAEAETNPPGPWLDVLDLAEFCDLWDMYDVSRDVLEACCELLAVDESSSAACILGDDRPDEGREKEPTVDARVEAAFEFLGEVNDHLANGLVNFFAGRRPLPIGNGDADSLNSGEAGSGFDMEVTTVEASLQQDCCQLCV